MQNLAHAARPLANDLASSLLFAGLLAFGVDAATATWIAMGFGLAHVALWMALKKPIAPLQWASLVLVLLFGAVGLVFHDPRFLMAKPSLIYLVIAVVMLKRGWMLRYMPPVAAGHGEGLMITFGYVWAGLMATTAVLNLAIAVWAPEHWPLYKAVFPIASKLALFAVQYLTVRGYVIRKVTASAPVEPQAA
ncbi:inner membrane-spanning protein YciB [Phenylobacterium sp. J367]|uniref:inner membrane-spanning protein YciB n=1 Tax=Phenylobacterium sp. J367 TaxID=2898435 RepID=UPI002151CC57|nr:septation protein IspZ [Phenylobacterium sp. J367]MCR5879009.1 septation protein IspZ [Phenylobacterium sp. J367]